MPAYYGLAAKVKVVPSYWICNVPGGTSPKNAAKNIPGKGLQEGSMCQFTIQCINPNPGVSKLLYKMAGGRINGFSPDLASGWQAAMKSRGMTYTPQNAVANNATLAGLIEIPAGSNYDGQPIVLNTLCIANKHTDGDGTTDYTTQITQQLSLPAGTTEGTIVGNGKPFYVADNSQTPPGTPTFRLVHLAADGSAGITSPPEGYSFSIEVATANMIPGTKFLIYAANTGQNHLTPDFRTALRNAGAAANCTVDTTYADVGPYQGGNVTFGPTYSDSNPIKIPLTIYPDHKTTGSQQLDFITKILQQGDTNNPVEVDGGVVSLFIQDTSVEPTPSYWRIAASRSADGKTLNYSLTSPTGASADSVTLTSTGNEPAGYASALAAAIAATPGMSISGNVITSSLNGNGFAVSWSVPNLGGTGKHSLRLSAPTGSSLIVIEDACVFFTAPTLPAIPSPLHGVALSGGEFATQYLPGTYHTNYIYPSRTPGGAHVEIDYHLGLGEKIIRLPVRWERIQQGGVFTPLSGETASAPSTWGSTAYDIARIDEIINYITSKGVYVLLDLHNYMYLNGALVGFDQSVTTSALSDLWCRIAARYASNPLVIFGIMNEPNGSTLLASTVADIMTSVVNAIRSRTGALNRIFVAGTNYTKAATWVSAGNGAAFASFADPAGNTVIEVHQYFDSDQSGTHAACVAATDGNLDSVTAWARANGQRLHLGEFAGGDPSVSGNEVCGSVVPGACAYMAKNADVWAGWTAWGGGSDWGGSYIYRLDPSDYTSTVLTGPMSLIEPYF